LREALKEKVAFVPGASFYADGSGANTMRLNFSYAKPAIIEEGIRRLGKVIKLMQTNAKPIELPIRSPNRAAQ